MPLCIQTSKPVELKDRANYHLPEKNKEFLYAIFFGELIPNCDTKTVPNGLRTQRIQRKRKSLREISRKFA